MFHMKPCNHTLYSQWVNQQIIIGTKYYYDTSIMILVKLIFSIWYIVMFCDYMYIAMIGCSKRTILIENGIIIEHVLPSYSSVCKNDQN